MRKVLGIVSFQMLFTLGVAFYSSYDDSFGAFVKNWAVLTFAIILLFTTMTTLL